MIQIILQVASTNMVSTLTTKLHPFFQSSVLQRLPVDLLANAQPATGPTFNMGECACRVLLCVRGEKQKEPLPVGLGVTVGEERHPPKVKPS